MLTNGWDQGSRKEAARVFQFDSAEFEARHVHLSDELDCGRLSLDMYREQVLFGEPRPFTKRGVQELHVCLVPTVLRRAPGRQRGRTG